MLLHSLAQAKTGTGKTLAFLVPVMQNILKDLESTGSKRRPTARDTRALIISPTRELAEQIAVEAEKVARGTGIVVQTAVGGTQKREKLRNIQRQGCHLLVGTPGRLKDILSDKFTGIEVPQLTTFVLDEPIGCSTRDLLPRSRRSPIFSRIAPRSTARHLCFLPLCPGR